MSIELPKDVRAQAVASIERWFRENTNEAIGNIQAAALLNFFIAEIAPSIYNQAVADSQTRKGVTNTRGPAKPSRSAIYELSNNPEVSVVVRVSATAAPSSYQGCLSPLEGEPGASVAQVQEGSPIPSDILCPCRSGLESSWGTTGSWSQRILTLPVPITGCSQGRFISRHHPRAGSGPVQQTGQIAASCDLSLIIRPHRRSYSRSTLVGCRRSNYCVRAKMGGQRDSAFHRIWTASQCQSTPQFEAVALALRRAGHRI